jgi:hypothetical protein
MRSTKNVLYHNYIVFKDPVIYTPPPHEQWLMAVVVGAIKIGCGGLQSLYLCSTT